MIQKELRVNKTHIWECTISLPFPEKLVNKDNWSEFVEDKWNNHDLLEPYSLGHIVASVFGKGYIECCMYTYKEALEQDYFEICITNLDLSPKELDEASEHFFTKYYDAYMSCAYNGKCMSCECQPKATPTPNAPIVNDVEEAVCHLNCTVLSNIRSIFVNLPLEVQAKVQGKAYHLSNGFFNDEFWGEISNETEPFSKEFVKEQNIYELGNLLEVVKKSTPVVNMREDKKALNATFMHKGEGYILQIAKISEVDACIGELVTQDAWANNLPLRLVREDDKPIVDREDYGFVVELYWVGSDLDETNQIALNNDSFMDCVGECEIDGVIAATNLNIKTFVGYDQIDGNVKWEMVKDYAYMLIDKYLL